jgi:hypothetical protein
MLIAAVDLILIGAGSRGIEMVAQAVAAAAAAVVGIVAGQNHSVGSF